MPTPSALRSSATRTVVTLAGAAAIALFAGCGGSDSSSGSSGGSGSGTKSSGGGSQITASTGAEIFDQAGCKSCHTLAAANASGVIGPNLDKARPPVEEVVDKVTNGDGTMPSFKSKLSSEQIQTVADYVAKVAGQ